MTSNPRVPLKAYLKPRVLVMLALGFSSGLPFLLTANTFDYWLRDEGKTLTAIGFMSWVTIVYSLKFLWAPLIDRVSPPLLGGLGRRRSWMLVAQAAVATGIVAMAIWTPGRNLVVLGAFALVVAVASATQDIVIDAWRIESAASGEELGLLTSTYQFGYRVALFVADALILVAADHIGWRLSYSICGAAMSIGFVATLLATEPARGDAAIENTLRQAPLASMRGVFDAIIGPFIVFFRTHGLVAILMLAAISLYRLPDFVMGPMANPFYHDIGLTKSYVGEIRGTIGLAAVFLGIAAGGAFVLRFGQLRALIAGGILQAVAIAAFATLAYSKQDTARFALVMIGDNFSTSFAGVALVAYMSSLTSLGYTATQYALLSSAYAWPGKMLKPFSGPLIDSLSANHGLMTAYQIFFVGAGLVGTPAIILFIILALYGPKPPASPLEFAEAPANR